MQLRGFLLVIAREALSMAVQSADVPAGIRDIFTDIYPEVRGD